MPATSNSNNTNSAWLNNQPYNSSTDVGQSNCYTSNFYSQHYQQPYNRPLSESCQIIYNRESYNGEPYFEGPSTSYFMNEYDINFNNGLPEAYAVVSPCETHSQYSDQHSDAYHTHIITTYSGDEDLKNYEEMNTQFVEENMVKPHCELCK